MTMLILALAGAAVMAILLAFLAHDTLGIARATIRVDALTSAAFMTIVFVGSTLRRRDE